MSEINAYEKKLIQEFSDINEENYKSNILKIINSWKIHKNKKYDFIIFNQAFNWKRLANLILDNLLVDNLLKDKILDWIVQPHLYGGFSETEFKKLLGYEKYSAHLSYFYGVTIERCLITNVEEELTKRQTSYGNFVRFRLDDAFLKIYNFTYDQLFMEFTEKFKIDINDYSELDDERFTYWCFKKRVDFSEPSKLASDTKKGTSFLFNLLDSESKRININNKKNNLLIRKKNIDYAY